MNEDLTALSYSPKPLPSRLSRKRDGFTRNDVVSAFQNAFELIGGVSRLTLWAHENPGDFFRLYAKLLPATTVNLGDNGKYVIEHVLGRTALDRPTKVIDAVIEEMTEENKVQLLSMANDECQS